MAQKDFVARTSGMHGESGGGIDSCCVVSDDCVARARWAPAASVWVRVCGGW